ncbi:MAG: 1,4-dihydroxy-2-naphthoate polyprenyltransferase [Acidimicrobiales bacterium]
MNSGDAGSVADPSSPGRLGRWVLGARPRTLGAAVSPVAVGTAVAALSAPISVPRAALALTVAVSLQVGVNYANDYSDGVGGVDADRVGPLRLTASGMASARAVKRAAITSFALAAGAGIALGLLVDWRMIVLGAVCVAAGALYAGGPRPYASVGLGEVMVLVFFGFVATAGSAFAQLGRVPPLSVGAAVPVGLAACSLMLANNLRDIASDAAAGKRTLAVRLGPARTGRLLDATVMAVPASLVLLAFAAPGALLALAATPLLARPVRALHRRDKPEEMVLGLEGLARFGLAMGALLTLGLVWQ